MFCAGGPSPLHTVPSEDRGSQKGQACTQGHTAETVTTGIRAPSGGLKGCAFSFRLFPPGPGNQGDRLTGTRVGGFQVPGTTPPMLDLLFRVKFLVMSDRGPMAETEWSSETRLQQGMRPGVQVQHEAWGLLRTWGGLGGMGQPLVRQSPSPSLCPILSRLGWETVGLGAVPGPPSQVGSLSSLPALSACGTPPPHLAPSAEVLQAAPGPQTAGTAVIIAILSVLLAILLAALLTLLIFTWYVDRVETPLGGWGP